MSKEAFVRQTAAEKVGRCQLCHRPIEAGDVKVRFVFGNEWHMEYVCPDCPRKVQILATLLITPKKQSRMADIELDDQSG